MLNTMTTEYLDEMRLDALSAREFQSSHPFPWVNPQGLLTEEGFIRLVETLPDVAMFDRIFGKKRKFGQQSHDRYALEYHSGLQLSKPWSDFIAELEGPVYRGFLRRMFGTDGFSLRFHWHYTPNGCSVSPHCDSRHKLGSHIFYLNTERDWQPGWGGQTLVLDDNGRFSSSSNPGFADFDNAMGSEALGNRSLLFGRKGNSWHGVKEISCPEDALRKVFIVVLESSAIQRAAQRLSSWLRPTGGSFN